MLRGLMFLLLVVGSAAAAQSEPVEKYSPTVAVDPTQLSPETRAALTRAMGKAIPVARWPQSIARSGDSLYTISKKRYGQLEPYEIQNFVQWSQTASQLDDADRVEVGQRVLTPPMFVEPSPDAAETRVQMLSATAAKPDVVTLAVCDDDTPEPGECTDGPLESARFWAFSLDGKLWERVWKYLPEAVRTELMSKAYIGAGTKPVRVQVNEPRLIADGHLPPASESLSAEVKTICSRLTATGDKLYLLDFFQGNCAHGAKVREAALLTLRACGAEQTLHANIVPVEMSFAPPREAAFDLMREYADASQTPELLRAFIDKLEREYRNNTDPYLVPGLYLQALYSRLLARPDTLAISGSFYITSQNFKVLPDSYWDSPSALVLGAVSDDEEPIEKFLYEPQLSLRNVGTRGGAILVGSFGPNRTPWGGYSEKGIGVTCVARGLGYSGTCLKPQDHGTSFATPSVGAMVLMASTYWRSLGLNMTADEIKRRVLLAADVHPGFVGRYASGGPINLERLLLGSGCFTGSGGGLQQTILSGQVQYVDAAGNSHSMRLERGSLTGLRLGDSEDFVFIDKTRVWERVTVQRAHLIWGETQEQKDWDRAELALHLKELLIL